MEVHGCSVRLLTIAEVQKALAIGRTAAYALVSTRQLSAVRIGRALRISEEDLRDYVERSRR